VNVLFPKIQSKALATMLGYGAVGAVLAGIFGIIHDQFTYTISPEYFTRLKFAQFHYADFELSPRLFVAEIGFLASWWVGFTAAWFIARVVVPHNTPMVARRLAARGFAMVAACATLAAVTGYVLGRLKCSSYDLSSWQDFAETLGLTDLPRFVRAAYIHNASYLGGLLGLIIAIAYLRWAARRDRTRVSW
jgi:hypothetical protein